MNLAKYSQCGRSMVEILGVLAVIGVLSVGGIAGYSKAMEKLNTNKLIEDISFSLRKIKNTYANQQTYEDIDKQVYALDLIQGVTKTEGMNKKIIHRLNGEVIVKPIAYNKGYVVIYNGLNNAACSNLASTDWGADVKFLVVSPTCVLPPRGYPSNLDWGEFENKDLPLQPAEAVTYCNCDAFYKCGIAWFF